MADFIILDTFLFFVFLAAIALLIMWWTDGHDEIKRLKRKLRERGGEKK